MNNVSMVGRLTKDPELKEARGGAVCQLRIAVDNPGRGGAPGEPTYIDVATFGKHAEACAGHLAKFLGPKSSDPETVDPGQREEASLLF